MTRLAKNDHIVLSATASERRRFWAKVDKTETCWLWTGSVTPIGHGRYWVSRTIVSAHRISKLWEAGTPQLDKIACHLCVNKHCVNPSHLYWGTHGTNSRDAVLSGNLLHGKTRGELHARASVSNEVAAAIWSELRMPQANMRAIAKKHDTKLDTVRNIKYGLSYTSVTEGLPRLPCTKRADQYPQFCRAKRGLFTAGQAEQICRMLDEGVRIGDLAKFAKTCSHTIHNIYYELRGSRLTCRGPNKHTRKMRPPRLKT